MAKLPKDIREMIFKECGIGNLVLSVGSGIASGTLIFTIVLAILMKNDKEMK